MIHLEDVLKMSWRHFCKTSWRRLENVLKTSWQDVLKTSWRRMAKTNILVLTKTSWRRLEDVFWRGKAMANIFILIKTPLRRLQDVFWRRRRITPSRRLQDVFIETNVCWEENQFGEVVYRATASSVSCILRHNIPISANRSSWETFTGISKKLPSASHMNLPRSVQ